MHNDGGEGDIVCGGDNDDGVATTVAAALLVLPGPPRTTTTMVARAPLSCSTVYNTLLSCLLYVCAVQRCGADAYLKNVAVGVAGGPYISHVTLIADKKY
uniref:Uncharacterized protein n=1 Tax=Oryza brachyantha TaxID=4533 RepID=J3L5K1_ORYBR